MPGLKSHIILPNRKPRYGAKLNRANPLSRGILAAYLFNEGAGLRTFNSVPPYHGTFDTSQGGGPGWTWNRYGSAIKGVKDATGVLLAPSSKYFIASNYPFTFMTRYLVSTAATTRTCILSLANGGAAVYQLAQTSGPTLKIGASSNFYIGSIGVSLNTIYTVAVVFHGVNPTLAASYEYYINGVPVTLTDTTMTNIGNFNYAMGVSAWGYAPNGWMDYLYTWNRALSQGEVVQLTNDPYSIFRPVHVPPEWQDMFTFPSGTGGGFDIDIEVELGGGGSVSGTTVSDLAWGATWGLPWP